MAGKVNYVKLLKSAQDLKQQIDKLMDNDHDHIGLCWCWNRIESVFEQQQ